MKQRNAIIVFILGLIISLSSSVPAYAAKGYGDALKTSKSMVATKASIEKVILKLDKATKPLSNLLKPNADLRKNYEVFSGELKDVKKIDEDIWSRAAEIWSRGDAYFKKWGDQLEKFQSETFRKRSADRRAKTMKQYEDVRSSLQDLKESIPTLLIHLEDIDVFLATELNPYSVHSISDLIEQAIKDATEVKEQLSGVMEELDEVSQAISPKSRKKVKEQQ